MSWETTEFIIYIINEIANSQEKYPSHVYKVLQKTDCINNYLAPFYDVLHTRSSQSVVEDVLEFIKMKGVSL